MNFSILVKVANGRLIGFLFDVDSAGFFEAQVEGLLVFDSYDSGGCIFVKDIIVVSLIHVHYLLNQNSSFEDQSVNFKVYVVDKHTYSMSLVGWVTKWDCNDISTLLVGDLKLDVWLIKHRGDGILPKDNAVPTGRVMKIVSNDSWAIIMEQYSFTVFFVGAHSSHVDCIVVVAEILVVICGSTDGYSTLIFFESVVYLVWDFGSGGREASLHFIDFNIKCVSI